MMCRFLKCRFLSLILHEGCLCLGLVASAVQSMLHVRAVICGFSFLIMCFSPIFSSEKIFVVL